MAAEAPVGRRRAGFGAHWLDRLLRSAAAPYEQYVTCSAPGSNMAGIEVLKTELGNDPPNFGRIRDG